MAQTVSPFAIACMAVSGLVALLLPIFLFLFARRRFRAGAGPLLAGVAGFVISVLFLEQLAHSLLLNHLVIGPFLQSHVVIFSLYGGLMAGLFEETARLAVFFLLCQRPKQSHLGDALAYGIGHGGIEAVLVCTLSVVGTIVALNMGDSAAAAELAGLSPGFFLISGLERVIVLPVQIALSVLVWMAASGRGPKKLFALAILLHLAIDFPAGFYHAGYLGIAITELMVAALSFVVCFLVWHLYHKSAQTYTPLLNYNPNDFGI